MLAELTKKKEKELHWDGVVLSPTVEQGSCPKVPEKKSQWKVWMLKAQKL